MATTVRERYINFNYHTSIGKWGEEKARRKIHAQ